ARGIGWFEHLGRDARLGARLLMRSPGFAMVALLTLGLGIGANTAMFTFVDEIVLRPLPYRQSERLVMVFENNPANGWSKMSIGASILADLRKQATVFEGLGAARSYGDFT